MPPAPEGSRWRPCVALLVLGSLLFASCATMLSSSQRQQLETKVYEAPFERTFAASRDAFVNRGYVILDSDFDGGLLSVSQQVLIHNPRTALTLSILLPPVGDFYMQRYGWSIFDLLLWPFSIVWAAPSNYLLARRRMKEVTGNLSFERLGEDRTRLRISLVGVVWDATDYPVLIRGLQEEVNRQLFIKEGDTLGGEAL
jgi:hypothetical protein